MVLIVDLERANAALDEWFKKIRVSGRDLEFDAIYVNGGIYLVEPEAGR